MEHAAYRPHKPDTFSGLPTVSASSISSLLPGDQRLFQAYGLGSNAAPTFTDIGSAFSRQVVEHPDAVAVLHENESLTYAELDSQANGLADRLIEHGVQPGDNVGLFLRRSTSMVVGILAILKVGGTYVPQDVSITPDHQLKKILEVTGAKIVLTTELWFQLVPNVATTTVLKIDESEPSEHTTLNTSAVVHHGADAHEQASSNDDCFILFTSGTTGEPNGVRVTHRNLCNLLLTKPGNLGIGPGMKVSQILNIAFDLAAWEILGALVNGATLVIRGSDIQETVSQVDVVIATPSVLGSLDASRCQNVQVVAVAGEPCPRPLADLWSTFASFHNSCGPTETTIVNTVQQYDAQKQPLSIGRPTPNNAVYILDDDLQPLPIGDVGEMWAGGHCVSAGYLNNSALTAERYRPDPFLGHGHVMFRTRDLGRWNDHGELEHHGRTDHQVKVRGFRVELGSVSTALESLAGCSAAATIKLDSQNLISFVQPATVDTELALQEVDSQLPYYAVPSTILALKELPLTPRGKVDRARLAALAQAYIESETVDEQLIDIRDPQPTRAAEGVRR